MRSHLTPKEITPDEASGLRMGVCFRRNQQVARKPEPCFAVAHVTGSARRRLLLVRTCFSSLRTSADVDPEDWPSSDSRTFPSDSFPSVDGEGHPVEIKMQVKVLWSVLLLLAVTPSVLSQSGTAPLVSSVATLLIVLN